MITVCGCCMRQMSEAGDPIGQGKDGDKVAKIAACNKCRAETGLPFADDLHAPMSEAEAPIYRAGPPPYIDQELP